MLATLAREAMEESQVLVTTAVYLGYQEVSRAGDAPFAQVRMAGLIDRFDPLAPDPDGGRSYRRLMTADDRRPPGLGQSGPGTGRCGGVCGETGVGTGGG